MAKQKNFKVADTFNGWSSEPMTQDEAMDYIGDHPAPTPRDVVPVDAEWRFDHRANEYAWFVGGKRVA